MTTESVARTRRRLFTTSWAAAAVIAIATTINGLPADDQDATAVLVVTILGIALWLSGAKITRGLTTTVTLTATGLCAALLVWLQPSGPGFVLCFMALAGIGLRVPRTHTLVGGAVVVIATAVAEALASSQPASGVLEIVLGAGFALLASGYAAASNQAHANSLELLRQEEATRAAREEAAALAERGRLARELHDVLAHTLSGLSLQLEGARLLADRTGADPRLTEQIDRAGRLAREGLNGAKRAVSTLRGDALPGPGDIPSLIDNACSNGLLVSYEVVGEARDVPGETGLALYRSVQEALTNATKYAGSTAEVSVVLTWAADEVSVEIVDTAGEVASVAIPSGGFGLSGLAERAALAGGRLEAGPTQSGWRVRLSMPLAAR